jgi:hypothetical protein
MKKMAFVQMVEPLGGTDVRLFFSDGIVLLTTRDRRRRWCDVGSNKLLAQQARDVRPVVTVLDHPPPPLATHKDRIVPAVLAAGTERFRG